jgi:PAS domain S-box-containing protein
MLSSDGQVRDSLVSARMLVLNNEPHLLTIFKDITERKKFVRALEESEKRFRGIFESNPDPVILSRLANGETIDVNKAFEVATGISRAEALGRTSEDMGLWLDPEQRVLTLERLRANGSIDNMEAVFKVRGGANKVGLLSARVINLNNEPCLLFVIRDISREKEAERALFEMDQMKNEFISTAAHELRTPLSTIMGYTELLMEPESFGGFTEEQKLEFHEVIYDKGEALIKIVDDLLDISRIESGHPVSLDFQDVDVRALLIKVINVFKISSGKHDYQIDLSRLEENCVLSIDRQRITQVLENLISNAVKYSPKGRRIIVRGESVREGLCVTVQDQGNGMTGEQVARIFDKFYRADASDTAVGGLGLGMSIARQIVEAHNGRIWVESTPGEGTKASFILPKA